MGVGEKMEGGAVLLEILVCFKGIRSPKVNLETQYQLFKVCNLSKTFPCRFLVYHLHWVSFFSR